MSAYIRKTDDGKKNIGLRPKLGNTYYHIIPYYSIDSVKRNFCRPCCYRFRRLKYIPRRLFSEYMLTFMVERPMQICDIFFKQY
jgi:hypothetical protein